VTVALCHGCFDILHYGHIKHLQAARHLCDLLIVSITSDRHFPKHKGANRPVFSEGQRKEMLEAVRWVGHVYICDDPTGAPAIKKFRPSLYVKGPDYKDKGVCEAEQDACADYGAVIVYTDTIKYGSGQLVEFFK